MSDKPELNEGLEVLQREVFIKDLPVFKAVSHRIKMRRRLFVRVCSALFLCVVMGLCWEYGANRVGMSCLLVWVFIDWRLRRWSDCFEPAVQMVAKRIEKNDHVLQGRLSTAVEQERGESGFAYMQQRLFEEVSLWAEDADWETYVSLAGDRLLTLGLSVVRAGAFFAALSLFFSPKAPEGSVISSKGPVSESGLKPSVMPGDVQLEKGSRLAVNARFPKSMLDVQLVYRSAASPSGTLGRVSMTQGLGEPLYGASLESIDSNLEYWVEASLGASDHYIVTVFEYPNLDRSDAAVVFPAGTNPLERTFENARSLTVPEGSSISWKFEFNKPLKAARVVQKDGQTEGLPLLDGVPEAVWKLDGLAQSIEARLVLEDFEGRTSKTDIELKVRVLPNTAPKIRAILPRGDARFTMVEEVDFEAEAWDDSALVRWGMGLQVGAGSLQEIELGSSGKSGQKVRMIHMEALEKRGVKVGDSISWYYWAEDLDGSGKMRRTESDLSLGRIRAFEETYRQDDSQEEGKGSGGPQLLELQKQVMAATWNLKRRLLDSRGADSSAEKNLKVLRDSEVKVAELASEKLDGENNEARRGYYRDAILLLERAVEELTASAADASRIHLAFEAERGAYDALTHVAPSSFMMKQSRASSAGKMEERTRQLSNLDFAKQEDRYQTKKEAMADKEDEEHSQMEELLAQLRALARRQEEMSERMREIESRIRNARDETEKEIAKRELKRLFDEQKTLARDLESLQQKAAQRNESLSEQSSEIDAAREASQRAASALEKSALDEARASAARSLEKLRAGGDSLRRKLSGRTREAARDLQERAQELSVQEQRIADGLENTPKGLSRLSEAGVKKEVESQRDRLKALQEEMQRASEATEASEPLFSKALQDAHRATVRNQTELKLKVVEEALSSRRQDVARRAERAAAQDIQELAAAVQKAADEVLGDDAEALRRARTAVDEIVRELSSAANLAMNGQAKPFSSDTELGKQPAGEMEDAGSGASAPKGGVVEGRDGESRSSLPDATGSAPKNLAEKPDGRGSPSGESTEKGASADAGDVTPQDSKSPLSESPAQVNGNKKGGSEGREVQEENRDGKTTAVTGGGSSKDGAPLKSAVVGRNVKRSAGGLAGGENGVPVQDLGGLLNRIDRVEGLLEKPSLRNGVARVQQVAEQLRGEMKRNASKPNSQQMQQGLLSALTELRDAISSELAQREGRESDSPVDRDPIPRKYEASVRRYYESLGGGK